MNSKNAAIILFTLISVVIIYSGTSVSEPTLTYIFGGPDTQEGKFEDEAGNPDMQGWECVDLSYYEAQYWHITTFNADGFAGPPDNHVLWCGSPDFECNGEPAPGYGNRWDEAIDWAYSVQDPELITSVRVDFQVRYDLQGNRDWLDMHFFSRSYGFSHIRSWTGTSGGVVSISRSFTIGPEDYSGENEDLVILRFRVFSNPLGSNEDCNYISDGGAAQLDNISIYFNESLIDFTDFEDEFWGLWSKTVHPGYGCFAQVWELLDDVDPSSQNDTPQLAFIDDGEIVPGTGGTYGVEWVYGPDSLIVNIDEDDYWTYNRFWSNSINSPSIPIPDSLQGLPCVVQYDVYEHSAACFWTFTRSRLRVHEGGGNNPGWSNWVVLSDWNNNFSPEYRTITLNLGEFLSSHSDSLKISLDAKYMFGYCYAGWAGTPAPYYDNVVIYVEVQPTEVSSIIEEFSTTFPFPNPFNPSTTIHFTLPEAQAVRLRVYAIDGRRIATLINGELQPGPHSVTWNGTDDQGRSVASGTYIYRLEAGEYVESKRMVLVR